MKFIKNTIPKAGQQAYYNENHYVIILVANSTVVESKKDKFPLTVCYSPINDPTKVYALPYWYFNKFYSYLE